VELRNKLPEVARMCYPRPAATTIHDLGGLFVGLSRGQGHDYASRHRTQAAHERAAGDVPNIGGNAARFVASR
jgi:hypothetical protein